MHLSGIPLILWKLAADESAPVDVLLSAFGVSVPSNC
jgi:hypothetical protein